MVQKLKYALIFTFIIIISSISFAINDAFTVPIYLTVPEYLKITDLSKTRLDLSATVANLGDTVEDSLTFNVESNVNYNLNANFEVDLEVNDSFLYNLLELIIEDLETSIKNHYTLLIKDEVGIQFVDDNDQDILISSVSPGIHNYFLTFQLDVKGSGLIYYPITEGKIGNIQITVSSN